MLQIVSVNELEHKLHKLRKWTQIDFLKEMAYFKQFVSIRVIRVICVPKINNNGKI